MKPKLLKFKLAPIGNPESILDTDTYDIIRSEKNKKLADEVHKSIYDLPAVLAFQNSDIYKEAVRKTMEELNKKVVLPWIIRNDIDIAMKLGQESNELKPLSSTPYIDAFADHLPKKEDILNLFKVNEEE